MKLVDEPILLKWELSLMYHFTLKITFKGITFIRRTNSKRNPDEKTNTILPFTDLKIKERHENKCYVCYDIRIKFITKSLSSII